MKMSGMKRFLVLWESSGANSRENIRDQYHVDMN